MGGDRDWKARITPGDKDKEAREHRKIRCGRECCMLIGAFTTVGFAWASMGSTQCCVCLPPSYWGGGGAFCAFELMVMRPIHPNATLTTCEGCKPFDANLHKVRCPFTLLEPRCYLDTPGKLAPTRVLCKSGESAAEGLTGCCRRVSGCRRSPTHIVHVTTAAPGSGVAPQAQEIARM